MHGQRDLLDWQDESIKEGIERERPADYRSIEERKMLWMVSGEKERADEGGW